MGIGDIFKSISGRARPREHLLDVGPSGLRYRLGLESDAVDWRAIETVEWRSIVRIELERVPTVTVELLYIILHTKTGIVIELGDLKENELFSRLTAALLARWPEIESGWTAMACGDPDVAERVTLWKAPEA